MKISVALTFWDHFRVGLQNAVGPILGISFCLFLLVLFVGPENMDLYGADWSLSNFFEWLAFLSGVFVLLLIPLTLLFGCVFDALRSKYFRGSENSIYKIELGGEGITKDNELHSCTYKWSNIKKTVRKGAYILAYLKSEPNPIVIPQKCFQNTEDANAFYQDLCKRTGV